MTCIWNLLYDIIDNFVLYFRDSFTYHIIFCVILNCMLIYILVLNYFLYIVILNVSLFNIMYIQIACD